MSGRGGRGRATLGVCSSILRSASLYVIATLWRQRASSVACREVVEAVDGLEAQQVPEEGQERQQAGYVKVDGKAA